MNFSDEEYVRLYVTDTVTWDMLGWEGNALLALALRKFDRAGVFEFGRHGAERALCSKTRIPIDVVKAGLEALLREEVWVLQGDRIFWPKYVDAQTCKRSDRLRQRMARARRGSESDVTPVGERDEVSHAEQHRDESSHGVTESNETSNVSQNVTLGEGVGVARQGNSPQGGAGGSQPDPQSRSNDPCGDSFRKPSESVKRLFDTWQRESGKTGVRFDTPGIRDVFEICSREGVTVDDVRDIVRAAKTDEWARKTARLMPAALLKNPATRVKYLDMARNPDDGAPVQPRAPASKTLADIEAEDELARQNRDRTRVRDRAATPGAPPGMKTRLGSSSAFLGSLLKDTPNEVTVPPMTRQQQLDALAAIEASDAAP